MLGVVSDLFFRGRPLTAFAEAALSASTCECRTAWPLGTPLPRRRALNPERIAGPRPRPAHTAPPLHGASATPPSSLVSMITAGLVLAGLAALLHLYIFYMESIAWTSPRVRATFGTSSDEAAATKELAFNQGFYNLFLSVLTGIGIVLHSLGSTSAGLALVLAGIGSMGAAAFVLFVSSPSKRGAALRQGLLPLLGVMLLIVGLLTR